MYSTLTKKVIKIVALLLILYICFCIFVFFIQKDLIFFPSKIPFDFPELANLEEVFLKTEDNIKLNAWYIDNKSNKTIIFLHGNGGNIFANQERLRLFNDIGINALMIDYRGYGKSDGNINNEEDLYNDANAAYQYIINKGIDSKNILIWGQSLGGSIAINLAQNKEIYAVIVESSFNSMDEMANDKYWFLPIQLLSRFHFRSDQKLTNIHSPILIIHSINDEMIDIANGQKLFNQANEPKFFLKTRGSHNQGLQESYNLYLSTIKKLLDGDVHSIKQS
jgi:uncharacterized protein